MYIVDRSVDETVMVGELLVHIVEVQENQVRLAVSSPRGVRRQEFVLQVSQPELLTVARDAAAQGPLN
jgi:sRNA-binding carbon storage regulator CsrA